MPFKRLTGISIPNQIPSLKPYSELSDNHDLRIIENKFYKIGSPLLKQVNIEKTVVEADLQRQLHPYDSATLNELPSSLLDQGSDYVKSKSQNVLDKHADRIKDLQSKVQSIKQKFAIVSDITDLSSAQKRGSLKRFTFFERLNYGGNFTMSHTVPFKLDLTPVVGYRLNQIGEVGLSGMVRYSLDQSPIDRYSGFGVYLEYVFYRNFLLKGSTERIIRSQITEGKKNTGATQTLLIGLGRRFRIFSWMQLQTTISYNTLYSAEYSSYSSPVVVSTGFKISKSK